MNGPVDVLALMDSLIDECVCGDHNCEGCLELIDAKLAMAELLASAETLQRAYRLMDTDKDFVRLRAAIARCGGSA